MKFKMAIGKTHNNYILFEKASKQHLIYDFQNCKRSSELTVFG